MDKNRYADMARYNGLYKKFIVRSLDNYAICFYCGELATSMDHQPPISRVEDYRAFGLCTEVFVLVSCCNECNYLGANHLHSDIVTRAEFINTKLRNKYKRKISIPDWTPEELSHMGPVMLNEIQTAIRLKIRIEDRLNFTGGISEWLLAN